MIRLLKIIFFLAVTSFVSAQDCNISVSGYVYDKVTAKPLELTNVFFLESGKGVVTDSLGFFIIKGLCKGHYDLRISHIACESEHLFLDLTGDTTIVIQLHHHDEFLSEVVVHGNHDENSLEITQTIDRGAILSENHKNIADILEKIPGVSALKTGGGISKPIVHGLSGNRVVILNNGIAQAGQQWGNDHAPEIDPFVADHISVVKGAAALAYGGNSLGGVVLVEPSPIKKDPHIHGEINTSFYNNGNGFILSPKLEKGGKWAAWRVAGSYKQQGDTKSPHYFLTNTGKKEAGLSLQLEKTWNQWNYKFYYSFFGTELGILRGAHVGNLTDLKQAMDREKPFFTRNQFSYTITAPRQEVAHHLFKLEAKYFMENDRTLLIKYGGQLNKRKEFDIRRGGRSNKPALDLGMTAHFFETTYQQHFTEEYRMKIGFQSGYVNNVNDPETGILPLIPDYRSYTHSIFGIYQWVTEKKQWEIGGRYDLRAIDVWSISAGTPSYIQKRNHLFHNYSLATGGKLVMNSNLNLSINLGYLLRSPEVNELYSSGVHQGVSSIEEGKNNLNQEKSLKAVISGNFSFRNKLFAQALGYSQWVNGYIYLKPENDFRLTIRGAFPVFTYQQTNAHISGLDVQVKYEPLEKLSFLTNYAIVRALDIKNNEWLVNIPPDEWNGRISYAVPLHKKLQGTRFFLQGKYIWAKNQLLASQDFAPLPNAYFLMGAGISTSLTSNESQFTFSFRVENMLNSAYRSYLNRLRYFADEQGVNFIVRVSYSF